MDTTDEQWVCYHTACRGVVILDKREYVQEVECIKQLQASDDCLLMDTQVTDNYNYLYACLLET